MEIAESYVNNSESGKIIEGTMLVEKFNKESKEKKGMIVYLKLKECRER